MSNVSGLNAIDNRVWFVEGGVHPLHSPELLTLGKFSGDPSQKIGEAKRVSAPDPNHFDRDIQIGTVEGETERATLELSIRSTVIASILQEWKNKHCRVDVYALCGKCGNPQDFTEGGEKWVYFPDGMISDHSFENFGAFGRDENNPTNEKVSMTAEEYYEFLYMRQDVIGAAYTIRELLTVDTNPGDDCDECPDNCKQLLITMAGASATPGTKPSLLYSDDSGETFSQQDISTLYSNEDIVDSAVIGGDLVLVSNVAHELHYTNIALLYDGTNVWAQNGAGYVAGKNPNAIWSVDVRHTWLVGNGGYIYFIKNHKSAWEVQDAGVATTQNLLDVHAYNEKNILAVGTSNAVVYSTNGGSTWITVTGPAVGLNLASCWMWKESVWFVAEGAGGLGRLWLTVNSGKTWTQVTLPGTYLRFYKIEFISEAEGYLIAQTGGDGLVLRTITAGNEWVTLPSGKRATAMTNTYLSDLAVCSKYANTAYAVGLADNGTSGVAYKFSG